MNKKFIFGIAGPLLGISTHFWLVQRGLDPAQGKAAALLVWMATWWVSEAVNIYITALLPIVFLPVCGVLKMEEVAPNYMHEIIFLFIGGFLFAYALEKWGLHRRIALRIILSVGKTPASVLFGVMFAAYFLSMWINNTATTAMLLPAVMAIGVQLERDERLDGITVPLLIGLGFAASIGGMATLIGTAPNMIFLKEYTSAFPDGTSIGFATWMMFGIPISMVIFLGCYYALRFQFRKVMIKENIDLTRCHAEYRALGKTSYEERWMLFFFIMAVLMWFFLSELKFGSLTIPSWTSLFGLPPKMIVESTVAMIIAFLLFFIPSRDGKDTLLSFAEVRRLPIGIIFLFGGGFAISKAVVSTGLDQSMAGALSGVAHLHPVLIVLILAVFMTLLSEFASNTASLQLVFPVLVSFVGALPVDPLLVLIPVTLAASCGFMLPIATPPNTIVFGSERITAGQMIKAGFMVDLVGIIVITISAFTLIALVLGV